ncbi:MAG: peptidase [Oscillospiraceae bacterium]|nr:peptidase [Oscillospiraceae bacterium]
MELYYFGRLGRLAREVYHTLYEGLMAMQTEIVIHRLETEELYDVFMLLRLDHPELFWSTGFKYKYYSDSPNIIFIPEYLFEKSKIAEHKKAMQARVARLAKAASENKTDLDKERFIHDFLVESVCYDKLKKPYSHEIIGPLGQGVGVCEGIAKSFKVLCDAVNIPCIIAYCGNNPDKGIKYRHMWNVVKIGGKWYHIDATFDNSLTKGLASLAPDCGEIRYDYFNLDDTAIFRDHEPLLFPLPSCTDKEHFFLRETKKSFTKTEDVYKRAQQAVKKNKILTFHWRGGYLTRDVLNELISLLRKAGEEKGKACRVSLNYPQAVISVAYSETEGEELVMEEANEGEKD